MPIPLGRRCGAEALGTFWLVLGGCGSAVLAAKFGGDLSTGIGLVGVALAFGLTVVTGAYAFGHISGGHFNPAVTVGLTVAKKFDAKDVAPYIAAQIVGAIIASGVLYVILKGQGGHLTGNFLAANGYGKTGADKGFGSPGGFNLAAGAVTEIVMTAFFLIVILGATAKRAAAGFGGLAIGLCLTLIHLISIPVTNTSVNPARSIGPALFVGHQALTQLWLFIVAPIVGAALGALIHGFIGGNDDDQPAMVGEAS